MTRARPDLTRMYVYPALALGLVASCGPVPEPQPEPQTEAQTEPATDLASTPELTRAELEPAAALEAVPLRRESAARDPRDRVERVDVHSDALDSRELGRWITTRGGMPWKERERPMPTRVDV